MRITPDYFHCITDKRFRECVYEPEADTFLLLETLDSDAAMLSAIRPRRCVEIGCGSGTVITHLCLVLSAALRDGDVPFCGSEYHAVDVNPVALEATSITWSKTLSSFCGGEAPFLHLHIGDLFDPFLQETAGGAREVGAGGFDVVLFNPPYVPTTIEELQSAGMRENGVAAAWCGGPRGRVVVDRFISFLPRFLSAGGVCYIVTIRENDVPDMMDKISDVFNISTQKGNPPLVGVSVVAERYTGEHLKVIRVLRDRQKSVCDQ